MFVHVGALWQWTLLLVVTSPALSRLPSQSLEVRGLLFEEKLVCIAERQP